MLIIMPPLLGPERGGGGGGGGGVTPPSGACGANLTLATLPCMAFLAYSTDLTKDLVSGILHWRLSFLCHVGSHFPSGGGGIVWGDLCLVLLGLGMAKILPNQ